MQVSNQPLGLGESFGKRLLLAGQGELTATSGQQTNLLRLSPHQFNDLIERYQQLGLKLYRNFCQLAGCFN